jgi:molybdopterin molybdotransferase
MSEFLKVVNPSDALSRLLEALPSENGLGFEPISTAGALGRVLAQSVTAPHPLPPFPRTTVDGFAVRAADTFGASAALPAYLRLVGEVHMGRQAELDVGSGQAALVHTGGMVPAGADAVVMLEDTQRAQEDEIEVLKAVSVGQNVLQLGEDVKAGEIVVERGAKLRPQEIGGLVALGIVELNVFRRPSVGILSTGDEVVTPETEPGPGQVRDVNSYTLSALVSRAGGTPIQRGIIPDRFEALLDAAMRAHREDDMLIITAGSSISARDVTADVIQRLGSPGVLVHGVSIKPGKPTILAVARGKPVIGLPGNPVSALIVAGLFVTPLVRRLSGMTGPELTPTLHARLSTNVASIAGREDYVPVSIVVTPNGLLAEPVYGRSNLIFTLVRADGVVVIPTAATGLAANAEVEVRLI